MLTAAPYPPTPDHFNFGQCFNAWFDLGLKFVEHLFHTKCVYLILKKVISPSTLSLLQSVKQNVDKLWHHWFHPFSLPSNPNEIKFSICHCRIAVAPNAQSDTAADKSLILSVTLVKFKDILTAGKRNLRLANSPVQVEPPPVKTTGRQHSTAAKLFKIHPLSLNLFRSGFNISQAYLREITSCSASPKSNKSSSSLLISWAREP